MHAPPVRPFAAEYLKPPFLYTTCVDRNHDGLIHTSRGAGDVRPWPNITDGNGGTDGIVQDAEDEAILVFQRVHGQQVRHVSVDADNNVWVGGYPFFPDFFDKLDGNTGAILFTFASPGCFEESKTSSATPLVGAPGGSMWLYVTPSYALCRSRGPWRFWSMRNFPAASVFTLSTDSSPFWPSL